MHSTPAGLRLLILLGFLIGIASEGRGQHVDARDDSATRSFAPSDLLEQLRSSQVLQIDEASVRRVAPDDSPQACGDEPEPWTHFPMEVGNVWEYADQGSTTVRTWIEGELTLGGIDYFEWRYQRFSQAGEMYINSSATVRYDSLSHWVLERYEDDEGIFIVTPCRFNAPPGSGTGGTGPDGLGKVCYGYGYDIVEGAGRLTIGDDVIPDIRWKAYGHMFGWNIYVCGFGDMESSSTLLHGGYITYARVGGQSYGTERHGVSAEPPPPATASPLVVHPNPSAGLVHVDGCDGVRDDARLSLYDALGRRVMEPRAAAGHCGGAPLDLSHLPAGTYVLVLTDGEARFGARVSLVGG